MIIPNPTDNDLQKAIDDITRTTSVEPMFSDPVAAPSMIPEGDNGGLAEAVGPFPEPKITIPEPVEQPVELPNMPEMPTITAPVADYDVSFNPTPAGMTSQGSNMTLDEVKKSALKDLLPLLDKMSINPSQKFRIFIDAFKTFHDYTIIESAYNAAREITDETERAEALYKIYNGIENM